MTVNDRHNVTPRQFPHGNMRKLSRNFLGEQATICLLFFISLSFHPFPGGSRTFHTFTVEKTRNTLSVVSVGGVTEDNC